MAEHFSKMSDSEIAQMQEHASFDIKSFIEETLSRPYSPKTITFMDILNKIDGIIDGTDGGKASAEMLASTQHLREALLQAQKDVANGVMTVEKEIEIKQIAEQILATEEESGLAIAIKETTVAEEIEAVYKDIFTEDKLSYHAKYNDIFYPMPSSFSQEIEDLQTRIIREKYPDFLPMDEALEKYGFKADPNNPETKDQKAIREEANRQTIEDHGGQEAHDERSAFIRGIYRKYPNNLMDKFHNIPNAKERANVFNAAVYESLESGSDLQEAVGNANHTISFYLDNNELWTQRLQGSYDFFIGEDEKFLTPDMEDRNNEEIIYDGYKLDLRKYGFDRDIGTRRIYDDEAKMVTSIQNQLDYANFLIDNPEIV